MAAIRFARGAGPYRAIRAQPIPPPSQSEVLTDDARPSAAGEGLRARASRQASPSVTHGRRFGGPVRPASPAAAPGWSARRSAAVGPATTRAIDRRRVGLRIRLRLPSGERWRGWRRGPQIDRGPMSRTRFRPAGDQRHPARRGRRRSRRSRPSSFSSTASAFITSSKVRL